MRLAKKQQIVVYDNGEDNKDRSFTYKSTNSAVAKVDANGSVTPVSEGRVNFLVTEKKSNKKRYLKKEIVVSKKATNASGGFNFSGGTSATDLKTRAEILGKLEKYAMDSHLTGITLFDNGGYVKYADRVVIPTAPDTNPEAPQPHKYIQGFGFGVLSDGELNGTLPGTDTGIKYPSFYHTSFSQDSLKINMYSATGSQVSDLASYISASYWGTKLNETKDDYEWMPSLAMDKVYKPILDANGVPTGENETTLTDNVDPIPIEKPNKAKLYRKWRIYVKTDATFAKGLKFTKFKPQADRTLDGVIDDSWNNRGVTIEDYLFPYKLLLTGSNNLIRGTEMANDTSYGIKGAQRYFNETKSITDTTKINAKWKNYISTGKLGLSTGADKDGAQPYIDIELINPIDAFTAKYTLSSNLVSPLPEAFFVGPDAISAVKGTSPKDGTMNKSAEIYGTFNNGEHNEILNNTICLGPYTLTKWTKEREIVFTTNNKTTGSGNSHVKWYEVDEGRYKINGIYFKRIQTDTDTEKNWKQFKEGNLDSAGVPTSQIKTEKGKALATKGDSTFKLNVNSCTQTEWDKLFWKTGKAQARWKCKDWMSNQDFLDGLFYSIDRKAFADKRGVSPSVNYFSDAYQMRNSEGGSSYNETDAHKEAVKGYAENYGYNKDKAIDCFRNAVKQLNADGKLPLGTKEKPTPISIHIMWMYQTDKKEYGNDIKYYFESAFNNDAVCGGRVKLTVEQGNVTNWEDVYNVYMMQGRFDLGFGAISGNTYNPLNFLEVLKSDNSSGFTLNWGPDTSKIDPKNPIIYKGQKWSFDALWEVADHGGIVENGQKIKPVRSCTANLPTALGGGDLPIIDSEKALYQGFRMELPVDFAEYDKAGQTATFDVNRLDCYVYGYGNVTLAENTKDSGTKIYYDKSNPNDKKIVVEVSSETAQIVNEAIKTANNWTETYTGDKKWQNNPFVLSKLGEKGLFCWELYYELVINGGAPSINYAEVKNSDN